MAIRSLHAGLLALLLAVASHTAGASEDSPWADSYDAASQRRFIPVELWTGGDWDGSRELVMSPANLSFGKRWEKRIRGPMAWTLPATGEVIQVYERVNKGKKQLFTLTSRGDGLGRVYDSRYARDCVDEVKFPLGFWAEHETRVFDVSCNAGKLQRRITLTIEWLDFSFAGVPHSLQFRWVVDDGKALGTDMRYIYSPGRGLVSVEGD